MQEERLRFITGDFEMMRNKVGGGMPNKLKAIELPPPRLRLRTPSRGGCAGPAVGVRRGNGK
jgi:hypothetical protein